jgi:hypothetical protein
MALESLMFWQAVVKYSSMWSMAGITVLMLGASREKKRVPCLKI